LIYFREGLRLGIQYHHVYDITGTMHYEEEKKSRLIPGVIFAVAGIIAGFALCRIIIVPFNVPDDSMAPGLHAGDTLIILKHVTPKPGDIILIESPVEPGRYLVKRVIAGEGSTVEIKDKICYVNGDRFTFTWKTESSDSRRFPMSFTYRDTMPPVRIGRNEYFVLDDNLDHGFDSRTFGVVRDGQVVGRMACRF
jgi:signal peptidase I